MSWWDYLIPYWRRRPEHNINIRLPVLTSLGLAVIDEIRFGNGKTVTNVLGGSGTYCTVGARLFTAENAASTAWMVHAGIDFPTNIEQLIRTWGIEFHLRKLPGQLSTRGLLTYADTTFGPKTFKYTTPVLSVLPDNLKGTDLLASQSFHILCNPDKIQRQVREILAVRSPLNLPRPLILWEPSPPACVPENLSSCLAAMKAVDVFSPNHLELLALFDVENKSFSRSNLEHIVRQCLDSGIGPDGKGVAVIRAGEHGCVLMSQQMPPVWFAPYYSSFGVASAVDKVVDTTGAGNAFLGGFAVGYFETQSFTEACYFGTVAASFVLEQIGVPLLDQRLGSEHWNGENPRVRLRALRESLQTGLESTIPEKGQSSAES